MTLLARASMWWRRSRSAGKRQKAEYPIPPRKARVPGEYLSLHVYLDQRHASTVVLTFEQVEALLGFALPASAHTERNWWVGPALFSDRHADAWTEARRTATPNLSARTVSFERWP
jgi:hypothetical protein